MQAIARVNRVFKDKEGGLIVDYVGIASALKAAMKEYEKKNKKKEIAARDSANGIHIEGKTGR